MPRSIERELQRTRPNRVVFIPGSLDGSTADTGNEHFIVFLNGHGEHRAVWTQSTFEGRPDMRMVFARSPDGGHTWEKPLTIAGPSEGKDDTARWGFPLVSSSGRITVLYNRYAGRHDVAYSTTGVMAGIFSDDDGQTWSAEQQILMPRTIWDHPDPEVPCNWIVWQKPERLSHGKYFAGFTRWVTPGLFGRKRLDAWWAMPSITEFLRFENLDQDPEPRDLEISYFMQNEAALQAGLRGHPEVPVLQEPSIVPLPDGRLFCVMRATTGSPYYSLSFDQGETWQPPLPLRQNDRSLPLLHPISPCPIYAIAPGEYLFFFHNHDGRFGSWTMMDSNVHRRPVYFLRGQFRPGARQPIWFSEPNFFFDNEGVSLLRADLSLYTSTTPTDEGLIFWYPERKFFLLGKEFTREGIADIEIPAAL